MQHPAQKPVALLEYLIGKSSDEGGLVLDPFMGIGSTCVAARNTRRRYVGIEIDGHWHEQALQRLAQEEQ
jgi:adenine-specific DNA-methyltransferase